MMQQLIHTGAHAAPADGSPPWAPSAIPSVRHLRMSEGQGDIPLEMTQGMIDETIAAYAAAARRAQEGGLDGVEMHYGHSFLIMQFLSATTNRRTDRYGGSPENRRRFGKEVAAAIRQATSPDFIIGARLSGREGVPGGLEPEDCKENRARPRSNRPGRPLQHLHRRLPRLRPPHRRHAREARIRAPLERPCQPPPSASPPSSSGASSLSAEADALIARGDADMVSMIRATIADPEIVRKTQEGRPDDVRPCLGCNQGCIGGSTGPLMQFGCVVNVGAGQELRFGDDKIAMAGEGKRVLVAGGGPAGLEAARVAALRGHHVTLCEASDSLGGQVKLARKAPTRDEFGKDIDWCKAQLRKLEVDIRLNTRVERDLIDTEMPDAVIVATGSVPRRDGFQAARPASPVEGMDRDNVFTSWEVMSDEAETGDSVVVFDDVGHYEAIAVAEYLLEKGVAVTFATAYTSVGPQTVGALMRDPALRRLTDHRSGFTLVPRVQLAAIGDGTVTVRSLDSGQDYEYAADSAVVLSGNVANRSLANALDGYEGEVVVVGDAVAPRRIERAVHDGHYAALRIGGEESATSWSGRAVTPPANPLSGGG